MAFLTMGMNILSFSWREETSVGEGKPSPIY